MTYKLLVQAEKTHLLSKTQIVDILKSKDIDDELFFAADRVRKKYVGDAVHLRALIEFSNFCKNNCLYCGLRLDNKNIKRYRLSESEILKLAEKAIKLGYKTIVLQSGEDVYFDTEKMCSIIENIKKHDVALTLSIGEKSYQEYLAYKKAGADRFLIRIETTDENLYKNMHPNMNLADRYSCLENLGKAGFEVGSGCLVGLPEQRLDSLADDILFFKRINADMVGIGPFIPNNDTPLGGAASGSFFLALKVMALVRLLLPNINIPATTAMETIHNNGRKMALCAGANVFMPNFTDAQYSKLYDLYPGKTNANLGNGNFNDFLKSIGRYISNDKGFRLKS